MRLPVQVSTRLDPDASVVLVGPPRVRQVRHQTNCSFAVAMVGLVPTCGFIGEEAEQPFGSYQDYRTGESQPYRWISSSETNDFSHISSYGYSAGAISGAGYLLPDLVRYLKRVPNVYNEGSELYPYSHWETDLTDL